MARPPRLAWIVRSTIETDPDDGLGDGVDFGLGVGVGVGVSVGAATNGVGWSDGAVDGVTTGDAGARAMCWAPVPGWRVASTATAPTTTTPAAATAEIVSVRGDSRAGAAPAGWCHAGASARA